MDELTTTIQLTAEIVSNYVANNSVSLEQLPELIKTVNAALRGVTDARSETEVKPEKATAAQIKRSIKPEGLISFIDGKAYKTLKRHLGVHGLTIGGYKDRFGLPSDYPSTASDYSARRSAMALSLGLGKGGRKAALAKPTSEQIPAPPAKPKRVKKVIA